MNSTVQNKKQRKTKQSKQRYVARPSGRRSLRRRLTINQVRALVESKKKAGLPYREFVERVRVVKKEAQSARQAVVRDVAAIERVDGTSTVHVPTSPFIGSTAFDIYGVFHFCECLMAHYAMTGDLFSNISPMEFMYYNIYIVLLYLQRRGSLDGASFINAGGDNIKLAVPYALAKYLEYCAPYEDDVSVSLKFVYSSSFFPAPTTNAAGNIAGGGGYLRTVAGSPPIAVMPQWSFLPMTNTNTKLANLTPPYPQMLMFKASDYTKTFEQFCTQAATGVENSIGNISQALTKRGNCISLSKVPVRAPDSTAYSKPVSLPQPGTYGVGGAKGVNSHFDPELTAMFSPVLVANDDYSGVSHKPIPNPIFSWDGQVIPAYTQVASVWVFMAQTYKGKYQSGKINDAFPVLGVRLKSLFPQEQPVNGDSLSQLVQSNHNQLMTNKSLGQVSDLTNKQLTVEAMIAFSCLQRRMNLVEVCHFNSPYLSVGLTNDLVPQFLYADGQWSSVNLPPEIAVNISAIGVAVNDGLLRIPVSNYEGQVTSFAFGNSVIGPPGFSAYGFTNGLDAYFKRKVLMTTRWGSRTNAVPIPTPPNIVYDGSVQPPLIMNSNITPPGYMQQYYGYNASLEHMFPMLLNGGSGTFLLTEYNAWILASQAAQQQPLAQVTSSLAGDHVVMTMSFTWDPDDLVVNAVQPLGVPGNTPQNPDAAGGILIANSGPSSAVFSGPVDPVSAAFAGINFQGEIGQGSGSTPVAKERFLKWKLSFITHDIAIPTSDPNVSNIGPHTLDYPWATGFGAIVQSISQKLSNPTAKWSGFPTSTGSGVEADIVSRYKKMLQPTFLQFMSSVPLRSMAAKLYAKQVTRPQLSNAAPSRKHRAWDNFKKVADGGLKIAGKIAEHIGKQAESVAEDL